LLPLRGKLGGQGKSVTLSLEREFVLSSAGVFLLVFLYEGPGSHPDLLHAEMCFFECHVEVVYVVNVEKRDARKKCY
jgi:hypothetical protein